MLRATLGKAPFSAEAGLVDPRHQLADVTLARHAYWPVCLAERIPGQDKHVTTSTFRGRSMRLDGSRCLKALHLRDAPARHLDGVVVASS